MRIFNKNIKGIIFDMDGTLIDSTSIWHEIDLDFFAKRGYKSVPKDYANEIVHMGLLKGAQMTLEKYGVEGDTVDSILKEWRDASIEKYKHEILLKPYAKELLDILKEENIKMALATANDEELYKPCLERLGLINYFDLIIDINMAKEGKSSPKIYLDAAKALNSNVNETIVFEDTVIGLKTAKNAGFITIGVDDIATREVEEDKKKYSDRYIYSFMDVIDKVENNMNFEMIFVTNNKHKLEEARSILSPYGIVVYGLNDLNIKDVEVEENGKTYYDNALIKAQSIVNRTSFPVFADDSGLEIEALDNKPGIYSARYAESLGGHENAMKQILEDLKDMNNRSAKFVCNIVLLNLSEKPLIFEGVVNGTIGKSIDGNKGFGYDPIFVPNESEKTFANLNNKNAISHRGRALRKMVTFLKINNYIK